VSIIDHVSLLPKFDESQMSICTYYKLTKPMPTTLEANNFSPLLN